MSDLTVKAVREMVKQGMTDAEIGAALGKHRVTILDFRRANRIKPGGPAGLHGADRKNREGVVTATIPVRVAAPQSKLTTIAEFLMNKRRAVCPVCQLKEPVRALVLDAKKHGERQADIIEYLHVCHRVTITPREFASHVSGRHDQ